MNDTMVKNRSAMFGFLQMEIAALRSSGNSPG